MFVQMGKACLDTWPMFLFFIIVALLNKPARKKVFRYLAKYRVLSRYLSFRHNVFS